MTRLGTFAFVALVAPFGCGEVQLQAPDASVAVDTTDVDAPARCVADGDPCNRFSTCFEGVCGGARAVAVGSSCAIRASGSLWCWGDNAVGQAGAPPTTASCPGGPCVPAPARVAIEGTVTQVSRSYTHACAVTSLGEVWCWGENSRGQLGHDPLTDGTCGAERCNSTPQRVSGLPASGMEQVVAGDRFTCSRSRDRQVWCWGDDQFGALGDGAPGAGIDHVPDPVVDLGLSALDVVAIPHWAQAACAVRLDGSVWCWGRNAYGVLGHPQSEDGGCSGQCAPRPVRVRPATGTLDGIVDVDAGYLAMCGRKQSGAVHCWGTGIVGVLGPSAVDDLPHLAFQLVLAPANEVVLRGYHACIRAAGDVWCWGVNAAGQLGGNFTGATTCSGLVCSPQPRQVLGVDATAIGSSHVDASFALTSDGHVLAWGNNTGGMLGHVPGTAGDVACSPNAGVSGLCNPTPSRIEGFGP